MSSKVLIILMFSLIIVSNCQTNVSKSHDLITISNNLALDLLNTFPTEGNNFFSPLSLTIALLTVMNGAKGVTDQEFRQLFKMNNQAKVELINENVKNFLKAVHQKESNKLILKLATQLLVAGSSGNSSGFPLSDKYKQAITEKFESSIKSVNFKDDGKQIIKDINQWVSQKTSGKIQSLFKEDEVLDPETPMVLLNAVYFKGMWKYVFDKKDTRKDTFYNHGDFDKATTVDMMFNQRNMIVKHSANLGANVFEMPFGDDSDLTMLIILPDELDGLDAVTKKLTQRTLNHAVTRLSKGKVTAEKLIIPKFKLEQEYDLKDYLQKLGLKSVFDDSADLSGVNGAKNIKIRKAIHKAYIEVNEEGAEAAAVTSVLYATRSFRPNPVQVDRPFLFAIIDKKSSLIWFLGQIRSFPQISTPINDARALRKPLPRLNLNGFRRDFGNVLVHNNTRNVQAKI